MIIPRNLHKELLTLAREFPIVALLGPRQSGKTTLARLAFKDYQYVSFEEPDMRDFAREDPRGFLEKFSNRIILDEIQRIPELLSYLQTHVDKSSKPGQFIITGSQNYLLMQNVSQSLAGRVGISILLPLSAQELAHQKSAMSLEEHIFTGGYPRIYDKNIRPAAFYQSYLATYIERDVRLLRNITKYDTFATFIRLMAGRTGQILNTFSIADDCGISHNTVKEWLSILETSYIIFRLHPFHKNFNKRLIKSPKIYFYDTGLVCNLLGIESPEQFNTHYYKGALFETFIISEMAKNTYNAGSTPRFYFWRDNHGHECDLIVENKSSIKAVEIKSSKTLKPEFLKQLTYWISLAKLNPTNAYLVYGGDLSRTFRDMHALGWKNCCKALY